MKKRYLVVIILLTLTFISFSFAKEAIFSHVIDGDTIHVVINGKEEKVRILFIDTPEKYSGAKLEKDAKKAGISAKAEQELGKLSTGYAMNFFHQSDNIVINSNKKDKYGRMLGAVSKNGVDYSTQIIKDGYSCIYKKADYPKELDIVMQNAKNQKIGLWGIDYDTMSKLCK